MKTVKLMFLIGSLCAAFSFGCATDPAGADPNSAQDDSTSSTEQDIVVGGDGCGSWSSCYSFCRRLYQCTSAAGCDSLTNCLNNCDSSYPSSPGSCPYPQ
jgi:hypothetical protein